MRSASAVTRSGVVVPVADPYCSRSPGHGLSGHRLPSWNLAAGRLPVLLSPPRRAPNVVGMPTRSRLHAIASATSVYRSIPARRDRSRGDNNSLGLIFLRQRDDVIFRWHGWEQAAGCHDVTFASRSPVPVVSPRLLERRWDESRGAMSAVAVWSECRARPSSPAQCDESRRMPTPEVASPSLAQRNDWQRGGGTVPESNRRVAGSRRR